MAPMAASAAWIMGEWDQMAEYVSQLDDGDETKLRGFGNTVGGGDGSSNGTFFRAVLLVRRGKHMNMLRELGNAWQQSLLLCLVVVMVMVMVMVIVTMMIQMTMEFLVSSWWEIKVTVAASVFVIFAYWFFTYRIEEFVADRSLGDVNSLNLVDHVNRKVQFPVQF